MFLSHWPVKEVDIERVEIPRGYPVGPGCWELDERAGRLSVFCGTSEPMVVTYWGGFELPEEAPPALRYAALLMVGDSKQQAQRDSSNVALAAGIKTIRHKEASVTFQSPTASETAAVTTAAGAQSPKMAAANDLLAHFTRFWI
jgi:hypothetical protein